jgi:hypothetical protein
VVGDDVELIVVDNYSEDETPAIVAAAKAPLTYIRTDKNLGVGARNLGLQRARGTYIVCLDDDVFGIDRPALALIRSLFEGDPSIAAINFKVLDPWTEDICNWVHHRKVEEWSERVFDTYEITEGAVAMRRSVVAEAGWYPDTFFLSHEGPDLAFRMMNLGYRLIYRGDIAVKHWHASAGRTPWMTHYYDTRNQYWLAARNFPVGYALRYLLLGQASTFVYSLRDGHLTHWMRAVKDGLQGSRTAWRTRRTVTAQTMRAIREIDAERPSWWYMATRRIFSRGMRL